MPLLGGAAAPMPVAASPMPNPGGGAMIHYDESTGQIRSETDPALVEMVKQGQRSNVLWKQRWEAWAKQRGGSKDPKKYTSDELRQAIAELGQPAAVTQGPGKNKGIVITKNDRDTDYGFIRPDEAGRSTDSDIFFKNVACVGAFAGQIPPQFTRVCFDLSPAKGGRIRATNVQPEMDGWATAEGVRSGDADAGGEWATAGANWDQPAGANWDQTMALTPVSGGGGATVLQCAGCGSFMEAELPAGLTHVQCPGCGGLAGPPAAAAPAAPAAQTGTPLHHGEQGWEGGTPGGMHGMGSRHPMYKTAMCHRVQQGQTCPDGDGCNYAHSEAELRPRITPEEEGNLLPDPTTSRSIYVKNINPSTTTEMMLGEHFAQHGKIVRVAASKSLPKGFCIVEFADHQAAEKAVQNYHELGGNMLDVSYARDRTKSEIRQRCNLPSHSPQQRQTLNSLAGAPLKLGRTPPPEQPPQAQLGWHGAAAGGGLAGAPMGPGGMMGGWQQPPNQQAAQPLSEMDKAHLVEQVKGLQRSDEAFKAAWSTHNRKNQSQNDPQSHPAEYLHQALTACGQVPCVAWTPPPGGWAPPPPPMMQPPMGGGWAPPMQQMMPPQPLLLQPPPARFAPYGASPQMPLPPAAAGAPPDAAGPPPAAAGGGGESGTTTTQDAMKIIAELGLPEEQEDAVLDVLMAGGPGAEKLRTVTGVYKHNTDRLKRHLLRLTSQATA